mmetsp:Transcript_50116/g.112591  ORF Transcript_50116/g.112591 Transcript_50116/m.112591 type:complete len:172 (+) Transcript_50116:108-623(+)
MRRQLSRPKYLASGCSDVREPVIARQAVGPGRGSVVSSCDEENLDAAASRLRRSGEHPKRLCPLDTTAGRFSFRAPWPELEVPAKDVEAFHRWCFGIEEVLAQSFQDAQCPYKFLEPKKHGPRAEQVRQASAPWGFRDFLRGCDFPDGQRFEEWREAMEERQSARRRASAM